MLLLSSHQLCLHGRLTTEPSWTRPAELWVSYGKPLCMHAQVKEVKFVMQLKLMGFIADDDDVG